MPALTPTSVEYLGRVSQAELDVEVRGLLSFDDCPSILRASGLATLMRQLGKVIDTSHGSALTYEMSMPVDKIDIFLSHNWSVPRHKKFLCLAVHFNWLPAMLVTAVAVAMAAVLTARGCFPIVSRHAQLEGWKDPAWREGIVCTAIQLPVFLLVLLFWRDMLWIVGWSDVTTFLDKTCIHQEDEQIMRMGIERLGAFLMHSEQMLALYTETYLTKLWTTYEVASFLALHGADKMRVLPVRHAILLLLTLTSCWFFAVARALSYELSTDYKIFYGVGLIFAGYLVRDIRKWEIEKVALENRVQLFRVQDCTCAIEADRAIVYENISRLMRASGTVGKRAPQEDALEAFNRRVRSELMGAFRISLGRHKFRFRHYLTMGWFLSGGHFLDMLVSLHLGLAPRYIICSGLFTANWVFGIWTILFLLLERLASSNLHMRGPIAIVWQCLATLVVAAIAAALNIATGVVRHRAETSNQWLAVSLGLVVLAAGLSLAWVFGSHCCWRCWPQREGRSLLSSPTRLPGSPSARQDQIPNPIGEFPGPFEEAMAQVKTILSDIPETDLEDEAHLDQLDLENPSPSGSQHRQPTGSEETIVEATGAVSVSLDQDQERTWKSSEGDGEKRHRIIQSL